MATIPDWVPPVTPADELNAQRNISESVLTVAGDATPIPICYGKVQIGGHVFAIDYDEATETWTVGVFWCWGEIESFDGVWVNGAVFSGVDSNDYKGTTGQAADPLLSAAISGYADTLVVTYEGASIGICYSVFQYTDADYETFPQFVAELSARKVYDTRTSTTIFSETPALHLRDLITEPFFGPGESTNDASVTVVADDNDANVTTESRRVSGLVIDTKQQWDTWRHVLETYAGCWTFKRGDEWIFASDRPKASDFTITDDDMVAGSFGWAVAPPESLISHVRVWYTDATEVIWRERFADAELAGVDAGTTPRISSEIRLPGVQRYSQAKREAEERLNKLQEYLQIEFVLHDDHIGAEIGDILTVTHPAGITAQTFRVIDEPQQSNLGRPALRAAKYASADYDDTEASASFNDVAKYIGTPLWGTRYTPNDNMMIDANFADPDTRAWELQSGSEAWQRTLNGEVTNTPCLQRTQSDPAVTKSFLQGKTNSSFDVFIPANANDTIYIKARLNNTGGGTVNIPVSQYEYDGTFISTTDLQVDDQLLTPGVWTTVFTSLAISSAAKTHYLRVGLTQVNDNAIGTVLKCQWIWASKYQAFLLGFTNKTNWADDEQISIELASNAPSIAESNVAVWEEVPDINKTNSQWDIVTSETGFDLEDSAYAVTLTPTSTSGSTVNFTLGSGSWAETDVGKVIKNVSAGETGEAEILIIGTAFAICKITTAFTDTNAIASGDWELYAGDFVSGGFELSGAASAEAFSASIQYLGSGANWCSVARLDDTKAIVVYRGSSNYGKAKILTRTGGTLSVGAEQTFESATVSEMQVTALSGSKAIVVYTDVGNSSYGTACVMTISGTTITAGTPVAYYTGGATTRNRVAKLDTDKAIVAHRFNEARVLSISGTVITVNAAYAFGGDGYGGIGIVQLATDKVLFAWGQAGTGVYARVLTVSGTVITAQTLRTVDAANSRDFSLSLLAPNKAIVGYQDKNNTDRGECCVLTVSGNSTSSGTVVVFESGRGERMAALGLSSTLAWIYYRNQVSPYSGRRCKLVISGTTITPDTPIVYSSQAPYAGACKMTDAYGILVSTYSLGLAYIQSVATTLYPTNVHVPTINKEADSVDTTFYVDLNSVTVTETLAGQTANYAFCFNPTFTSTLLTGGTFIVIGSGETTARNITSSLNSVHGGTDGNWYINTHATYGSETWAAAATNTALAALREAEGYAKNNMSGTDVGAVADANWPAFGTVFSVGIVLYGDGSATPHVDKVEFNYDGQVLNILKTELYEIDMWAVGVVRLTAPSSGGPRNARVYIK